MAKHDKSKQNTCFVTSPHHMGLGERVLESVLQTVQKQFTYRQYILTDCTEDNVQNTHTYTQYTQCTIRHT